MGDMTRVKRQLSMGNAYDIDDVSVGQRVRVFGLLTNSMASQLEMDAGVSNLGQVNMHLTTLRGTVVRMVGIPEAPLPFVINVQAIDGRHIGLFDFSGTGDESGNDSDPAHYEIDTAILDVSALADGTPVRVRGFVRPFGQVTAVAPIDFAAQSIVDVSTLKAVMAVGWYPASATAISSSGVDGLQLNLDGVGLFHHVARARVATDLTSEDVAPSIVPLESGAGLYFITQAGVVQLHTDFALFAADLDARLSAGAPVKHVVAHGPYDDANVTMSAGFVSILLE